MVNTIKRYTPYATTAGEQADLDGLRVGNRGRCALSMGCAYPVRPTDAPLRARGERKLATEAVLQ